MVFDSHDARYIGDNGEDLGPVHPELTGPEGTRVAPAGQKYDAGKAPWHLVPWDAVEAMRAQLDELDEEEMPGAWDVLGPAGRWFHRGSVDDLALAAAYALQWLGDETGNNHVEALAQVVDVLKFGAFEKPHPDPATPPGYGERNWENGLAYSRLFSAMCRHVEHAASGGDGDLETGYHPLAHAVCDLLFLLAFELRGRRPALDDRPGELSGTVTTVGITSLTVSAPELAARVNQVLQEALEGYQGED